jgi:hypothetical protein
LHKDNLTFSISEVSAEAWLRNLFFSDKTLLTGQSVCDVPKECSAFFLKGPEELYTDLTVNWEYE